MKWNNITLEATNYWCKTHMHRLHVLQFYLRHVTHIITHNKHTRETIYTVSQKLTASWLLYVQLDIWGNEFLCRCCCLRPCVSDVRWGATFSPKKPDVRWRMNCRCAGAAALRGRERCMWLEQRQRRNARRRRLKMMDVNAHEWLKNDYFLV